jgi:hypothetical protein
MSLRLHGPPCFVKHGIFLPRCSMAKIMFFIDGFSVYYSLKDNVKYHKYLWLDFSSLAKRFTRKQDIISGVYYFSAYATWKPNSMKYEKEYIQKGIYALSLNVLRIVYQRLGEICCCIRAHRDYQRISKSCMHLADIDYSE